MSGSYRRPIPRANHTPVPSLDMAEQSAAAVSRAFVRGSQGLSCAGSKAPSRSPSRAPWGSESSSASTAAAASAREEREESPHPSIDSEGNSISLADSDTGSPSGSGSRTSHGRARDWAARSKSRARSKSKSRKKSKKRGLEAINEDGGKGMGVVEGHARVLNDKGKYVYGIACSGGKPSDWEGERRVRVKKQNHFGKLGGCVIL